MAGRSGSGCSFSTSDRLHRPSEFSAAMSSRVRRTDGCFELRLLKRQPVADAAVGPRLGLIVPKRFAKRAVLRNLLKRLARESFRASRTALPAGDFVLRLTRSPLASGQSADRAARQVWRGSVDRLLAGIAK